jgi:cyclohexanone monooxygenase
MTAAEVISNVQLPGLGQQRVDIHANLNGTGPAPLLAGSEAVHAKYREERDKRLKLSGGVEQYRSIEAKGQFSKYLKDPWSEPITRDAVKEIDDVVVIGGGYGAQLVAVKLLEAGITNFRLVEKAGDFGKYHVLRPLGLGD